MWLARTRFRRTTELGRKAAIRAAKLAERDTAALVIQKFARRRLAFKHVSGAGAASRSPQEFILIAAASTPCTVGGKDGQTLSLCDGFWMQALSGEHNFLFAHICLFMH